jgi:sodium/bile acid cotransporter 7
MPALLRRLMPDRFVLMLIATLVAASVVPARGIALDVIGTVSIATIMLVFFLHGVRLSHDAVVEGLKRWRLQLAIFAFGYAFMPLVGLGAATLGGGLIGPGLTLGVLYLCAMPTTVQSSISYAAIARGNVVASVIASAASNISGVVVTPLLVALLASAQGGDMSIAGIGRIFMILLLPFALGQLARRWLADWASRRAPLLSGLDRGAIILAVFVAFSEAVTGGLWQRVSGVELAWLLAIVCAVMAIGFAAAWTVGGWMQLERGDRISFLFSGAHKSVATGAPMARILFPGAEAGAILLPLLLYHQLQMMLSGIIATRLARNHDPAADKDLELA